MNMFMFNTIKDLALNYGLKTNNKELLNKVKDIK